MCKCIEIDIDVGIVIDTNVEGIDTNIHVDTNAKAHKNTNITVDMHRGIEVD